MGGTIRATMLPAAALLAAAPFAGAPAMAAIDRGGPDAWSRPGISRDALVEPVVLSVRETHLIAPPPPPAPAAIGPEAAALAGGGLLLAACGAAMLAAGLRRAVRPTRS